MKKSSVSTRKSNEQIDIIKIPLPDRFGVISGKVKNIYPSYFEKFRCIADKCPDSCCKGWDVVVNDETNEYYKTVGGDFGEKLNSLTEIDSDGDRVFISQNGRCPFWNDDELCDIYINLGEKHLCKTCREFPRLTQDYTVFTEHLLSFACPEAARLMLGSDNAYDEFTNYALDFSECDYSAELMRFLLGAREKLKGIFTDKSLPFSERLNVAVQFCEKVQSAIDEFDYSADISIDMNRKEDIIHKKSLSYIFEMHKEFDIMTDEWREILCKASEHADEQIPERYDDLFERMALYYIYRYFLTAVDSMDVMCTAKRIFCAYVVIGCALMTGEYKAEKLFCLYSKEVEHSYDNAEYFTMF